MHCLKRDWCWNKLKKLKSCCFSDVLLQFAAAKNLSLYFFFSVIVYMQKDSYSTNDDCSERHCSITRHARASGYSGERIVTNR